MKLLTISLLGAIVALLYATPCFAEHKPDPTKGKELFESLNCSMCHPGGDNALNPKKKLRGPDFRKSFPTDADIARVIRMGVPGTCMDAFRKDRLPDDQLADVIAYIRALPQPDGAAKAPAQAAPSKVQPGSTRPTSVTPAKCPKGAVPAARSNANKKSSGKSSIPAPTAARGTSSK